MSTSQCCRTHSANTELRRLRTMQHPFHCYTTPPSSRKSCHAQASVWGWNARYYCCSFDQGRPMLRGCCGFEWRRGYDGCHHYWVRRMTTSLPQRASNLGLPDQQTWDHPIATVGVIHPIPTSHNIHCLSILTSAGRRGLSENKSGKPGVDVPNLPQDEVFQYFWRNQFLVNEKLFGETNFDEEAYTTD